MARDYGSCEAGQHCFDTWYGNCYDCGITLRKHLEQIERTPPGVDPEEEPFVKISREEYENLQAENKQIWDENKIVREHADFLEVERSKLRTQLAAEKEVYERYKAANDEWEDAYSDLLGQKIALEQRLDEVRADAFSVECGFWKSRREIKALREELAEQSTEHHPLLVWGLGTIFGSSGTLIAVEVLSWLL